jgi:hypothetical protein
MQQVHRSTPKRRAGAGDELGAKLGRKLGQGG